MRTGTISEMKRELALLPEKRKQDIILRLAKYKKETKELLHYLLFEAHDEDMYIDAVKADMAEAFDQINVSNVYWAKKTVRKTLRIAIKHIRFSGQKQTEVELLLYFCRLLKESGLPISTNPTLVNINNRQIGKIEKALSYLHEDLQFDYKDELTNLKPSF